MSKYLSLVNGGSGKLGEVVLQRNNVQRVRKREIKNPKSRGQQIARMIAATATRTYSMLKGIVDHSFAGVPYGGKSMNYFIKNAMRDIRAAAIALTADPEAEVDFGFSQKDWSGVIPGGYLISKGNLQSLIVARTFNTGGGPNADTPIFTLDGLTPGSTGKFTPAMFAAAGVQPGDQLTFCCIPLYLLGPTFLYARLIFKPTADFTAEAFTADMFDEGSSSRLVTLLTDPDSLPNTRNLNYWTAADVFGASITYCWIAGIVSRLVDGVWQRSTERLGKCGHEPDAYVDNFAYDVALPTWLDGGTSLAESDRYLNEG